MLYNYNKMKYKKASSIFLDPRKIVEISEPLHYTIVTDIDDVKPR